MASKEKCTPLRKDIDISKPRFDQNTYIGRFKHFLLTVNPLNCFASTSALEKAKETVTKYKNKEKLCITEDELWEAKNLYDSAYHPDTGEVVNIVGRMSSQPIANTLITAGMMTFYKGTAAVLFWQWLNQSVMAIVNFSNRSGDSKITDTELYTCYALATSTAVATALSFNRMAKHMNPIIGRFVPFFAVCAANCVNVPMMRKHELVEGTPVFNKIQNKKEYKMDRVGLSKNAAFMGVGQVIATRIAAAAPVMLINPFIMDGLSKRGTLCRYPWIEMPITLVWVCCSVSLSTPAACAIFKQEAELPYDSLENELKEKLKKNPPKVLYFNKGL